MAELKLKISYNGFDLELDGEESSVRELFNIAKEDMLLKLINRNNFVTTKDIPYTDDVDEIKLPQANAASNVAEEEYPSLFDLVMKNLPQNEPEWVLVYCFYASNYGETLFDRNQLLNLYEDTKRATESRRSNLRNSLQTLFRKDYIKQVNTQDMTITGGGILRAKEIIFGLKQTKPKGKKEKTGTKESSSSTNKSVKRETYSIIDLGMSDEEKVKLKEIYSTVSPKTQKEQIVLLCYLLKDIKGITIYNPDTIHTALKVVDEKTPKVLSQALRDIKSKDQYIDRNQDGTYFLNHVGEDFVKFTLLQGVNK